MTQSKVPTRSGGSWRTRAVAVLVVLLIVIGLQNVEPVSLEVLVWDIAAVPKLALMAISFAMGAVTLWTMQQVHTYRRHR